MNKNTLTVLIVILTPIIILGILAVAGAEKFEKQKETFEAEQPGENTTETAAILVPLQNIMALDAHSSDLFNPTALRVLV
jgi:hypothetical protein